MVGWFSLLPELLARVPNLFLPQGTEPKLIKGGGAPPSGYSLRGRQSDNIPPPSISRPLGPNCSSIGF